MAQRQGWYSATGLLTLEKDLAIGCPSSSQRSGSAPGTGRHTSEQISKQCRGDLSRPLPPQTAGKANWPDVHWAGYLELGSPLNHNLEIISVKNYLARGFMNFYFKATHS